MLLDDSTIKSQAAIVVHNFWAQAGKLGIFDYSTGLSYMLDLLVAGEEEAFADALERLGYTITRD